ncbi:E3 ubiquitin-protein ligase listerin-like isoform X2 [Leptotrombidium deliense]|uniref:E3 ubiquitin-protein ligase listerin n=1 Tax=Leptotrombidium deliense TaxID=299467 RepID=A0A443S930_9ACAR|nr:E3 ubiquitin-protein ligase listerin-like isoform X2 [Leptotrombidium deliense]
MGGKKAQRTKGNTRPSSSGRTALLLSENVTSSPFVGFSAFKEANCENSAEAKNDEFDLSNDADICLVFKKLQKKDNITKTKALLEFAELCDDKDEDLIKALLPFWPKFYNKLALDLDWKVREAVHKAMHRLVNRLKREIAPILKNIMPVWLISFFDPYAPAASAAIISFNESFTNEKQKDYVQLMENILKNDMNVISPESEVEKKEFILLNSSMKAMSLLLVKLDKEYCLEFIESLLESEKFWSFCCHKNADIRFSWFKMKTTVCEVYPDLVKKYSAKVCQTSLNYITDNDPNACSAVWENCSVILPIIDKLPSILDYFPNEAFDEKQKFIQEFFSVFDIAVRNSEKLTHEFHEIVVSYFRCLKYFVTTSKIVSVERHEIFKNLVNTQVKPMLQRCILDSGSRRRNSLYYKEFTMFAESLDGSDEHSLILSCIEDTCRTTSDSSFNSSELLSGLMHFIHELTSSTGCNEKPLPRRVKFSPSSEPPKSVSILKKKSESKFCQSYEKVIVSLVDQVIKTFEIGIFDSRWLLFLKELSTVVTKSEQLFLKMVEFSNAFVVEKVVNNIVLFTEDPVVKRWTKNDSTSYVMMVAKELVKLIHVSDRKKDEWDPLWNSLTSLCSMKEIRDTCLSDIISLFEETVHENNLNPSDDVSNKREKLASVWTKGITLICEHCESQTKNACLRLFSAEFHKQLNGSISTREK